MFLKALGIIVYEHNLSLSGYSNLALILINNLNSVGLIAKLYSMKGYEACVIFVLDRTTGTAAWKKWNQNVNISSCNVLNN